MNWRTEWRAISDRIVGLVESFTVFMRQLSVSNSDGYGVKRKHLLPEARAIYAAIKAYYANQKAQLPTLACAAIERFIASHDKLLTAESLDNIEAVGASVTFLAGFRAEVGFHLADIEATSVRLAERAFTHLQRQIIVDETYATRWRAAFEAGERECEKLGSVHLLQHGIWAFKASAAGERTDLILSESLSSLDEVAATAEALVLTEWKKVSSNHELDAKLEQAKRQASLYAVGSLAGLELGTRRYLVMVSRGRVDLPPDGETDGVLYCARNIAVQPATPSRS